MNIFKMIADICVPVITIVALILVMVYTKNSGSREDNIAVQIGTVPVAFPHGFYEDKNIIATVDNGICWHILHDDLRLFEAHFAWGILKEPKPGDKIRITDKEIYEHAVEELRDGEELKAIDSIEAAIESVVCVGKRKYMVINALSVIVTPKEKMMARDFGKYGE